MHGSYTIGAGPASCTNYLSFASAINDLNIRGIDNNVRFDIPAGYTENLSAPLALGSALLNGNLSGKTLSFTKSGAGANPLLNAYAGTGTPAVAKPDGFWKLKGVDNVTIDGIDLLDGNTTAPGTMEYGFGLFKYSTTDGAQNNTIQNCTVTLNKTNDASATAPMVEGSTGILVLNAIDTLATTIVTPAAFAATNSNNKFYSNTIQNCHHGIVLSGYDAPSPFTLGDTGNDIGGINGTGNQVLNFGNNGDATATAGIRALNQWGVNISNNIINNNNGSGSNTTNILRGIWAEKGVSAGATINNNTIAVANATTGGNATTGIDNAIGATASANTVTISSNIITGSATLAASAPWTGINNTATAAVVNMNNNSIQGISLAGTGTFAGIVNGNTAGTNSAVSVSISNNTINNNSKGSGTAATVMSCISIGGPLTATVNNNIITNNTLNAAATTGAVTFNCVIGAGTAGSSYIFNGNTVSNNSVTNMPAALAATLSGFINNTASPTGETITNNRIANLFVTGVSTAAQVIQGIRSNTNSSSVRTINGNVIDSLYTAAGVSGTITGILSQLGQTVTISKNKISKLFPGQNASSVSVAKGISITAGTTHQVFNNMINLDLTQAFSPAADAKLTGNNALIGIEVSNSTGTPATNLYYNTIRLSGNGSGTGFGSSGIHLTTATATIDMRNNIVSNFTTPGGTSPGFAVALRKTTGTYASTSNNNDWYAGTPSISHVLYFDGTTGAQNIVAFRTAAGAPRETNSLDDQPAFVSVTDLHLAPGGNCNIEGGGIPIGTPAITDDIDGDVRNTSTPDIGADEFDATGGSTTWKGYNTNWMDVRNWCGVLPTGATNVTLPGGKAFYPDITTAGPIANNVAISAGASISISAAGTFALKGSFTNNGTLTNNGMILMNGTLQQTFPGTGTGILAAMKSLQINNAAGVNIDKPVTITGELLPTLGTVTLNNNNITITSNATGTARVGAVGTSNAFVYNGTGRFVVERYIPGHSKAWQLLATPTSGQTVNQSWQEGNAPAGNTVPGYGAIITGTVAGQGFDIITPSGSTMKSYNFATQAWQNIGTTSGQIADKRGYMLLVRGDRSVQTAIAPATPTTLRTTGKLFAPGTEAPASTTVQPSKFESVGNPYASAIDFTTLSMLNVDNNKFYVWDPLLSGTYGLGGYQLFIGPAWTPTPGGTANYPSGVPVTLLQSGQAFIVFNSSASAGTVTFAENNKAVGNQMVFRLNGMPSILNTSLLTGSAAGNIADGNTVSFDMASADDVDAGDALKPVNTGENFGILKQGRKLIFEARQPVADRDTLFYTFSNLRTQAYTLRFAPQNVSEDGLTAFLVDQFAGTRTAVSLTDTSYAAISITADPRSAAPDRFMIVFRKTPPVSYTGIEAVKQGYDVKVTWKVTHEVNIENYEVEKSEDGIHFSKVGAQLPVNAGSAQYSWLDEAAVQGMNYYRIRSTSDLNAVRYSDIAKVNFKAPAMLITLYPDPLGPDKILNVKLSNQVKGQYVVTVSGINGGIIERSQVDHPGRDAVYPVPLRGIFAHGTYLVTITDPGKKRTTFKIVY
jgi:hypothetical protein